MLASLVDIQPGAEVLLTSPTAEVSRWTTTSLQVVLKDDLPQGIFSTAGARRLVIVTCGGPFDRASGHYLDNVIVTAIPLDPSFRSSSAPNRSWTDVG